MAGGPVRQPYAGVDFIPQSGIFEFGYRNLTYSVGGWGGGGVVSKYLSQMVEDACSALAQPVAADGTVADPQAGRTRPLRVLNTKNKKNKFPVIIPYRTVLYRYCNYS